MNQFVHLHCHSDYSILDGHSRIPELAREAARLNQSALAMTDHGSVGGLMKHWKECNSVGIKPILGCEFYLAPGDHALKEPVYWGQPSQRSEDVSGQGAYTHCTVIATSTEGLRNLFRLYAASYSDGFYRKPRISLDLLEQHHSGLVVTTGCAGGAVPTLIRLGLDGKALEMGGTLRDIFGDRVYVEIMEHENPIDRVINPGLIDLAKKLNIKLLATNDSHYTLEESAFSHDALICLQTGQKVNGTRTFKFEGTGYHLRSAEEMAALFVDYPGALKSTLEVAERVEPYRNFDHILRMPRSGWANPEEELHRRISAGARSEYEFETITAMGYSDYFLILDDILKAARERGITVGPGRGSGCGSLVAYDLNIHQIDPIEHGLIFERFLNPERVSLPDIDIDIPDNRRDEFLEMVREMYGEECVAQITTYGIIGSKSSLHDAARVLGHPRTVSNELTYRLPPSKFGRMPTLSEGSWDGLSQREQETLELATTFEGIIRNQGTHASGVVISPGPLEGILPTYRPAGQGAPVTAFDMNEVSDLGFVKMDFLGLNTLGVIDECVKSLRQRGKPVPHLGTDLESLNDRATYALLSEGKTLGVFQLDSPGMQQLLRSIKPTSFSDIAAVLALYRPGPMGVNAHHSYAKRKNGREGISFPHRELDSSLAGILGSTYGLVVFQEQVLEILKEVCGYTYSSAALIFDAMRKKDTGKMLAAKPDFTSRMKERGYSQECVNALWDVLVPFSDYSFAKAHSTGYGVISYWTGYLKTHHSKEWMSALLTKESDPKKLPVYLTEIERMGIPVLPPDVNHSLGSWTPTDEGIRYGLSSIKNLAEKAYGYLTSKRPYKSLDDFYRRAPAKALNARTLQVLVKSGALDSLCPHREEHLLLCERFAARALEERRVARGGGQALFSERYSITSGNHNSQLRKEWEQELLGTTFTFEEITLRSKRWLTENEFFFLKKCADENVGRQRLSLALGYATVEVGYVDWNDRLRREVGSLGCVEEI